MYYSSTGKESSCNVGDLGSVPGLGRYPGEGKSYPLQYSGLENSIDYSIESDMTERLSQLLLLALTQEGFPDGASGKELACQCRRPKRHRFWVEKIPWRSAWQRMPVFMPGESHEQRSLVGYSP